ncbi:archaeosortase/exosortase family protein [Candidatus Woesearchaeota archaeon]|nr:archaeosortase/exosortase family protein [Candidatus Woesearchaeota archaeon]
MELRRSIILRSALYCVIIVALQFFFSLFDRKYPFPGAVYTTDLVGSALFVGVVFLLLCWDGLKNIQFHRMSAIEIAVSSLISILLFSVYLFLKLSGHHDPLLRFPILFFACASLLSAVFGSRNIRMLARRYQVHIVLMPLFVLTAYFAVIFFRGLTSSLIPAISRLIILPFPTARLISANIIKVDDFIITIAEQCSGIESLLLFLSLFLVFWIISRREVCHRKMLSLLLIGLFLIWCLNIFRLMLLIWVGLHSRSFALGLFHSNISWLIFLAFFCLFWSVSFRFARKPL